MIIVSDKAIFTDNANTENANYATNKLNVKMRLKFFNSLEISVER